MPDADGWFSRADLASLIGIAEVQVMLSRGRRKVIARSYVDDVTHLPGFPEPLIAYPREPGRLTRVRLWLPGEVEDWMRRNVPGWDHLPPAPLD